MMYDIEPELYTVIATRLREKYGDSFNVVNKAMAKPSQFPAVAIAENGSMAYSRTLNSKRRHTQSSWTVEIHSNDEFEGRYQCKEIAASIDEVMIEHNFVESFGEFVASVDAGVTRRVHRYTAIVSESGMMFRR